MDSSNGTAQQHLHEHEQNSSWTPPRNRRHNPLGLINNGGIGHPRDVNMSAQNNVPSAESTPITTALNIYDKQYLPHQPKSLSGISTRSFLLGIVLGLSINLTLYLLTVNTPLWRAPFFLAVLCTFHYLEFWTTAHYNTRTAQISSFLLSQNGSAYNIAHTTAILECLATNFFFPTRAWIPTSLNSILLILGLSLILLGQVVRSIAMCVAGTNFNHIVQHTKSQSHQLVTTGIYAYLRHPSYFGFFWWGLGTQLVLGNTFCFVGYGVVLWRFFSRRISGEEELLVAFFGDEYLQYRKRTRVGIPFVS